MTPVKHTSLSQQFALYTVILAMVLLLLVTGGSWLLLSHQRQAAHEALLGKEIDLHAQRISARIQTIHDEVSKAARSSLIATALVDSYGKDAYLVPFLQGLRQLDGVPVALIFTDFEGKEIARNGAPGINNAHFDWLSQQLAAPGQSPAVILGSGEAAELVQVEWIYYSRTKTPEGALLYRVLLKDLIAPPVRLHWAGDATPVQQRGFLRTLEVPDALKPLGLSVDPQDQASVAPIPGQPSALLFFLGTLIIGGLAIWVSRQMAQHLTKELRRLSLFTSEVVASGFNERRIEPGLSREVSEVANAINLMLDRLNDLHRRLTEENEEKLRILSTNVEERKRSEEVLKESVERFRALTEMSSDWLWEQDADFRFTMMSHGITTTHVETFIGKRRWDLPLQGISEAQWENHRKTLERHQPFRNFVYQIESIAKGLRYFTVSGAPIFGSKGEFLGYRGIGSDITERKRAEEEMQMASLVFDTSSEAMMVTDADGVVAAVNPAFTQVTGYASEDIIGKTPRILRSGLHDPAFYQSMWQALQTSGTWQGEIWDRRKNGAIYPKWLTIHTVMSKDGTAIRRVAQFYDLTQQKKSEELIWKQANFDTLTGLPNRRMFMDRLQQEIKKSHRTESPLALLFLDLDRFKEVNDTLGHDVGDALLKEAAQRISGCVRESDTVARLGGDEFTVILGELNDTSSVERIAQNILRQVAEPFQLGDEQVFVSGSLGITFYPEDATGIEALLKNADQAMYAAKQQGRNRSSYFTPAMQEAAQNRRRLAADLRSALAANQFMVHYQPIVELATGSIQKAEALLRWRHPTRGLVRPAEFIPLAEDTGLIVDIGDWIFREVVRQADHWRASGHATFQVSVNVSSVQFRSENNRLAAWFDHLRQLGLPGQSIVLEITETMLLDDSATVTEQLLALREAGLQVALDDFGTGYSSLAYLRKFDIDYLKIDQSFVRGLTSHSDEMALCEAIIEMAHRLGLKVIAEGVETQQQHELLAAAGCDYAQGYWFSKPVPAEAFQLLLDQQAECWER